jgi:hypothetical protein
VPWHIYIIKDFALFRRKPPVRRPHHPQLLPGGGQRIADRPQRTLLLSNPFYNYCSPGNQSRFCNNQYLEETASKGAHTETAPSTLANQISVRNWRQKISIGVKSGDLAGHSFQRLIVGFFCLQRRYFHVLWYQFLIDHRFVQENVI